MSPALAQLRRELRNPGSLNYAITRLCVNYIKDHGGIGYSIVNEVVGALTCAQLELYRRLAAPYENAKLAENGDAYG
jgi:hypothetical protein